MDKVEMAIITEIGNEEMRDKLLKEHRKNLPKSLRISPIKSGALTLFDCQCPTCKTSWYAATIEKRCPNCNQALLY